MQTDFFEDTVARQRAFFASDRTKDIGFRIAQLKKLKQLLREYEPKLNEAICADFSKSAFDNYATELALLHVEINDAVRKIKRWSGVKRVRTNLANFPARSYIIPEPLGVSLVIGAWNYPYQLSLGPAIAAIAAGNTVIVKPSELPVRTSRAMAEMINRHFDPGFFTVVEGGVPETEALLRERFDKIFFTGSVRVGRIVYQAAARHLTPVTLELGGKSPAFVLDDQNMEMYVKRLVWAKFLNAGQTCIAPDYVLVHRPLREKFIQLVIAQIEQHSYAIAHGNYVQIIDERNLSRLIGLLDDGKIVYGGRSDSAERWLEPTVMTDVGFEDKVMQEEIFGPILPVIAFDTLDEAIEAVRSREKPLSCYVFTRDNRLSERVLREVSFGGGCVNDAVMHVSNSRLPFGGVGESGTGAYHGAHGFRTFSHYKSILDKPTWFESHFKYPPYTPFKLKWLKRLLGGH